MTYIPDISKAEYDILNVLWKKGKQSVREVHNALQASQGWAYTTTKTIMDRMVNKNLLSRNSYHGVFLYHPEISRPAGLLKWVKFFAHHILEVEDESVVAMFAKHQTLSSEELKELERLLKEEDER